MIDSLSHFRRKSPISYFSVILLVSFLLLSIISLVWMENIMLDNAYSLGTELSQNYTIDAEKHLIAYETMLDLTAEYVDSQLEESSNAFSRIRTYLRMMPEVSHETVNAYVVTNGRIFTSSLGTDTGDFDPTQTAWYQAALDAGGDIIFTDTYTHVTSGRPVITLARETSIDGIVVAFDIFPEDFRAELSTHELPQGSYYILCDGNGRLLYDSYDGSDISEDQLQSSVLTLVHMLRTGELPQTRPFVKTHSGEKVAVYYDEAYNGWMSLVFLPYSQLTRQLRQTTTLYAVMAVIFMLAALVMSLREIRLNRNLNHSMEAIRMLGNSYYAIYRINFKTHTYEIIKGSNFARSRLPNTGSYAHLMDTLQEVIEPSVRAEFRENFSMNNIHHLVAERVRDYGGDFLRMFNGVYRWVNVRVLIDESLSSTEAVLCFRLVNEEKERQLQHMELLKSSLETARRSEETRNLFFSSMSHDMRTPLNAIIGLSDLAQHHLNDAAKLSEDFRKINYSSRQLLSLINDILEISRMEQSEIVLNDKATSLRHCVEDVASAFHTQAALEQKHFTLRCEVQHDLVYLDAMRLGQILNNLLSNAFKFSPSGASITLTVREVEKQERPKFQFEVADTGSGISPEFLDQIYLPYERETRFGAKSVSGTGLGMPIVKNIVSQMGGQITVDSTLGKGTTFVVTLPLTPVPAEGASPAHPEEAPAADDALLTGRRILLAEDNPINMEIATDMLELSGMEVTQAWNGREALDTFRNAPPGRFDAILMDMQMPEMDGCQAAQAIRKLHREDARTIPILAVTANAFAEDLAATSAAGMNAHISKPIDFAVLRETLIRLLYASDG